MKEFGEYLKGKKVTLLGLGLLGRGVGDAAFLAECGAEVIVTDKKSEQELAESVAKLKKYPSASKRIIFHLGGHLLEDFTNADLVIKAASVPRNSPEIAAAKKAGVKVTMSTALAAKIARDMGAKIVGITGTRGKSTVTQMINHTLVQSGRKTLLGGNVRGISTLALIPEVAKDTIVVLELDSWQLQGFGDLEISPDIAVFTNLMPDHQNYYDNMGQYFADKENIFRYQHQGDALMVGKSIVDKIQAARPPIAPQVPPPIASDWKLNVIGGHNRENASLAAAVLYALGLTESEIKNGLESFKAVEGRLQFVREVRPFDKLRTGGVKIYNDNNATTPEATIAALRALGRDITLITGGSEKGLDLKELVEEITKRTSAVIVLVHANYKGSERLKKELHKAEITFEEADSLQGAVALATEKTTIGTILFSPAFASFGMFKNEYDRNDEFMRLVRAL